MPRNVKKLGDLDIKRLKPSPRIYVPRVQKKTQKKDNKIFENKTAFDSNDGEEVNKMFAIIETLGRQYKVSVGDKIKVDLISADNKDAAEGTKVTFDRVLMVGGDDVKVGTPLLSGASVSAKVVEQGLEKKVIAFKKKRRKGYTRKVGFRRAFTVVEIEGIKAA